MTIDREHMDNEVMDLAWNLQERIYHDIIAAREAVRSAATEYAMAAKLPPGEAAEAVALLAETFLWGVNNRLKQLERA